MDELVSDSIEDVAFELLGCLDFEPASIEEEISNFAIKFLEDYPGFAPYWEAKELAEALWNRI